MVVQLLILGIVALGRVIFWIGRQVRNIEAEHHRLPAEVVFTSVNLPVNSLIDCKAL